MERVNIDMWYGDKPEQVTGLDICFNDLGGFYCGFTVKAFDTLENLEKNASENGYKKAI